MNTVIMDSHRQEIVIVGQFVCRDSQAIIFLSVRTDNPSERIDDINFEIDFVLDNNQVSVRRKLDFRSVKCIQIDKIEHLQCPGVINTDAVFTAMLFKNSHECSRVRSSAKRIPVV
jgi:hypothetical protein